jgi:CRP/FNR family cyclic AMP-dependent transcriptional regulator
MRTSSAKNPGRPRPEISALLKRHPVFGALAPAQLNELCAYATPRQVKAGATIFSKGDAGTALFAIARGAVKISAPARGGREAVFNVLYEGEIFGEIALLDGHPRTAAATAMSDCELMTIQRRDFLRFVESEPKVALKLIELLCARLRFASEHMEEMVFLSLPARLARTLLRLSERESAEARKSKVTITQQEIGQIAGMTREHANKHLRAWAKHRWVRLERGGIVVLAPKALAAIAALEREGAAADV